MFSFFLNFLSTRISQIAIPTIPARIPSKTEEIPAISIASGIKSKQATAVIRPEASARMELRNRLLVFLKQIPITVTILPIIKK